jgi:hypothetical protein
MYCSQIFRFSYLSLNENILICVTLDEVNSPHVKNDIQNERVKRMKIHSYLSFKLSSVSQRDNAFDIEQARPIKIIGLNLKSDH